MRKVIVYCAVSVDGFIAAPDGGLDWLMPFQESGEDYGWEAFIASVDTLIMGRKTLDKMLTLVPDWPYKDKTCYVLSRTTTGQSEHYQYINNDIPAFINELKNGKGGNIYADGGQIVSFLHQHALIDEFILTVIPVLLGAGIPLFQGINGVTSLRLHESRSYPSGVVQLHYLSIK